MGEKILLFIPMYNCEKQITRVLDQIDEKISEYIAETIVVDNRSTDRSQEKVINYIKNNKNNIDIHLSQVPCEGGDPFQNSEDPSSRGHPLS